MAFYEILNGLWVRNGLQIKGQAMTYIQCNFCNSMVDADLYLLQLCCTRVPHDFFLNTLLDKFGVRSALSLCPEETAGSSGGGVGSGGATGGGGEASVEGVIGGEHTTVAPPPQPMLDSLLTFLATLLAVRTNLGLSELELNRLEMVTLLCMGDKTHSQLMELMPERCGTAQSRDFEQLLASVADYRAPNLEASGNMQQGMYAPKPEVWERRYDPLHVLLRSVHRRDFQTSMDRYAEHARQSRVSSSAGSGVSTDTSTSAPANAAPWPPFRRPPPCAPPYQDPCVLLRSRVFHAVALGVLVRAARGLASEHATALIVHLLDLAVEREGRERTETGEQERAVAPLSQHSAHTHGQGRTVPDDEPQQWYAGDCLAINLRTVIGRTVLRPQQPDRSPIAYSSDSDVDWVDTDTSDDSATGGGGERQAALPPPPQSSTGMEVVAVTSAAAVADQEYEVEETEPQRPALPPPIHHPAVLAGNEVGRRPRHHGARRRPTTTTAAITNIDKQQSQPHIAASTAPVNESIVSLLLRLHSQLSGLPDSYDPDEQEAQGAGNDTEDDVRCGDGPYHVARLLRNIARLEPACAQHMRECRARLWPLRPDQAEREQRRRESAEREERRRRAKERQKRLIEEFATRQRRFLETMETEERAVGGSTAGGGGSEMEWQDEDGESGAMAADDVSAAGATSTPTTTEYDCVICGQTSASTEDKPMGLAVLVQATSVLGHRRRRPQGPEPADGRAPLPTCEEERAELVRDVTQAGEFGRRCDTLDGLFERQAHDSWLLACNIGWEGGVHVQTCGHHLHLDCLKSYLESLRTQQRLQSLAVDKGEYLCPLCRQLANSVLPLAPQLGGERAAVVRSRQPPADMGTLARELQDMLRDARRQPPSTQLGQAVGKAMEDMTNSTPAKYKTLGGQPTHQSLILFVTSIARTNLEVELVQRGGAFVTVDHRHEDDGDNGGGSQQQQQPLTPKRGCLVPLLHVLAVHVRLLAQWHYWPYWQMWRELTDPEETAGAHPPDPPAPPSTGQPLAVLAGTGGGSGIGAVREDLPLPLLYRDPVALLLQLTLLLPLHMDLTCFTTVVRALYNLLYYQLCAQLACLISEEERAELMMNGRSEEGRSAVTLEHALRLVCEQLAPGELLSWPEVAAGGGTATGSPPRCSTPGRLNLNALERRVQRLSLPYLRCAALLRHHLYGQPLPEARSPECEFVRLVYFLELVTEGMDWGEFSAARALSWPEASGTVLPRRWLTQLAPVARLARLAARSLLLEQHSPWRRPRLLRLPREYERIFTHYHERQCAQCHSVPQETSVCLLCGRVVCLKQACCKQAGVCEAVAHAADCGAGTGLFLVVTSTYVIVIRGRRACLWGSLYLDDFEEEDRDLKRGKPLYLSRDRFQLLEQQWLAHRFDHTKKTWVWHRDAL